MVGYHPEKFGRHKNFDSEDLMFLFCHIISEEHVTQEPCDLISWSPLKKFTTLQGLVIIGTVLVKI